MSNPVPATPVVALTQNPPHPLRDFWASFSQNKGAMIGLSIVVLFILVALFAPWLAPMDPTEQFQGDYRLPPIWSEGSQAKYILGTDDLGRDLLSRLIYGARISMGVGLLVAFFALVVGTLFGMISGFIGGWIDAVIMRVVDILMSLPSILLAIVVVTVLGPGLFNAVVAVSIVKIPSFIRLVRASYLVEKQKEYVTASKSFGASRFRLAVIQIFPNTTAPLIIQTTLAFSDGILDIAALGFLGLGAQPPTPEWGTILVQAKNFFTTSPWFVTLPGLCILLAVLGFNLMGDGLRDALDPRMKK
jgi:ABC-type dipeptide/oligopeptide/nickel transport system permease subunit